MQTVERTEWTDESIINLIRKLRNDLIKDFLDERYLMDYLTTKYNIQELSKVKMEFIRNALKVLLIVPVDTKHYESIIALIKETGTASLSEGNEQLFYAEIDSVLKHYIF